MLYKRKPWFEEKHTEVFWGSGIRYVNYCKIVQKIKYTPPLQYIHRGNDKVNMRKYIFGWDYQENEYK